jgi:hypothetical protein
MPKKVVDIQTYRSMRFLIAACTGILAPGGLATRSDGIFQ